MNPDDKSRIKKYLAVLKYVALNDRKSKNLE